MIGEIHAFDTKEDSKKGRVDSRSDFKYITRDKSFKNVFGIKRILAIIIKETIEMYQYCSIDEIVDLIELVYGGVPSPEDAKHKTILKEKYAEVDNTIKYDIVSKVSVPEYLIEEGANYRFTQICLNLEMQCGFIAISSLVHKGLRHGTQLIVKQIPKVDRHTDFSVLMPVYSIWIALVEKDSEVVNSILRYQLHNTSGFCAEGSDSFIEKLDAVTSFLNLYFICIDKSILKNRNVDNCLDSVVEFVSLLLTGRFDDNRMELHDTNFQTVVDTWGDLLRGMAEGYSKI